ncbi:hypothetical protein [Candidatus Leptofilum sp.]|uniref:hypothetical protein n=1 Tax=Candidatus Leptofilum sp. TaxID=3241576 RepID=UPI003B5BFCB0
MVSADSGGSGNYFVGLWEGVDPNDGSRRTVSISDNDRDGVYDLYQYDTFWTLCGDDKGVTAGSATVGAGGVLHFTGTLTCLSTGTSVPFSVDYEAFLFSNTLVEIPLGVPLAPATLHRTSSR